MFEGMVRKSQGKNSSATFCASEKTKGQMWQFCGQEAKTYVLCLQVSIDRNWMFMCLYDSYYYFRPEEPLWKSVSSFAENKDPKKRATVTNT